MHRPPLSLFTALAVAALCASTAAADQDSVYRLFIGDHADGMVRAIDLADGSEIASFAIDQTPALTRSTSGRTIFAVQGDAGKIAVIDTGIAFEDHGDHRDLIVSDARLLNNEITGTRPAHVVEGSGRIAVFDDGTGDVTLFGESDLLGDNFAPTTLSPGAAHHGLAAPMGDYLVISVPDADPEQPRLGLRVIGIDGSDAGDIMPCPGVHGQAQSARVFAFGCRDGVVLATPGEGGNPPALTHLPTGELGEGHVSTLKGGTSLQFFLGNFGADAMVIIEPDSDDPFRRVDLPTRRVDFVLDPVRAQNAYILTEDGQLHLLNILTGQITQSLQATGPYSMDGHWRDPRPRLAVAGDHIAITDPATGTIRLIATDTMTEAREFAVEGTPYTIVAVGGSGAVH